MTGPGYTFCNSAEEVSRYAVFDACKRSDGSPCASCKEHADLDDQLVQLLDRRRKLRTRINQCHDPVTSILPTEITSRIFELSLPEDWFFGQLDGLEIDDDAGAENDDKKLDSGPLLLGAVCRAWRHIAWSTPSLWNAIHIFLAKAYRQRPQSQNHVEIVSEWLGRSGQLPLFVHLSPHTAEQSKIWAKTDPRGCKAVDEMYGRVIELVNQHSGRWEHLQMQGSPEYFGKFLEHLQSAPRLRTLKVYDDTAHVKKPLFTDMPGIKPHPERVTLMCRAGLKAVDMQWNHTTNVSIRLDDLEDCFTLLQSAPQLVHLKWGIGGEGHRRPFSIRPQPAVHHALQSLAIDSLKSQHSRTLCIAVAPFFDNFSFPHLNDLRINQMGGAFPCDIFLAHIKRSSCPLTSLALCNTPLAYQSVIKVLEETPLLRKLELESLFQRKEYESNFFRLLSSTSISSTSTNMDGHIQEPLLPNLEILEYTTWLGDQEQAEIFWSCIPDIFGSTSQFDHPKRRPLNTLRISWEKEYDYRYSRLRKSSSDVIGRKAVLRLLKLAEAGIVFDLRDSTLRHDLLKISMDHHGIILPQYMKQSL